ncbi:hypothetical protein Bca4012_038172 [Brassica carinata]|uniref:Uncharacterized protein n=1 Tax=Brassica carinata TaxID=52824 RepID=A0A8X7U795_BRACI|nr:hypothetical protein Bca52824_062982 [Brassica carinata]
MARMRRGLRRAGEFRRRLGGEERGFVGRKVEQHCVGSADFRKAVNFGRRRNNARSKKKQAKLHGAWGLCPV